MDTISQYAQCQTGWSILLGICLLAYRVQQLELGPSGERRLTRSPDTCAKKGNALTWANLDGAVEYHIGKIRPARRPFNTSRAVAAKQAQRLDTGIIPCPWPNSRRETRNPRKGKRGSRYSHPLNESKTLHRFEDSELYKYIRVRYNLRA